jgi:hypothetical protein
MEVLNVADTIYIYLHRIQNRRASSSEIYSSFDEINIQSQHTFQLRRKPKTMV